MRKFNENCILVIFVIIFIIAGFSGKSFTRLQWGIVDMLAAIKHFNLTGVMAAENTINKASSEDLRYHDLLIGIDSVRNNLLGTRVVIKDDTTVVKAYSDSLCEPVRKLDDPEIEKVVSRIQDLKNVSERKIWC